MESLENKSVTTEGMSFFQRCKQVFSAKRSNSVPCSLVPVEVEDDCEDIECRKKDTLSRSKSGRLKEKGKTRSLVSDYDFTGGKPDERLEEIHLETEENHIDKQNNSLV